MVNHSSRKTTRESELEKIIIGSWRSYRQALRDHSGGQGRVQAGDLGLTPLVGPKGRVFWGSHAKPGLVNSNPKQQSFGKFPLSKGHTRQEVINQARLFITRVMGTSQKEVTLTWDSTGYCLCHALKGGSGVNSRSLQDT